MQRDPLKNKGAPPERRVHLARLRASCLEARQGCEEVMENGIPG